MDTEDIFSGVRVVDFSSFIAGPGAAVILSDFGAEVIKVEPPHGDPWRVGHKLPPLPVAAADYPWQLNNRNKRSLAIDLKSEAAGEIVARLAKWADVLIVNTPQAARKRLHLTYEDVAPHNPRMIYADLSGYGDKGPDADLPGFDITAYWARSGLLALMRDAGAPPTLPVAGSGDHATAVGLFSAIVMGLYRRERTGKGSHVTTSLLASGVWACGVPIQGALSDARFSPNHDRTNPSNPGINTYRAADGRWFVLVVEPSRWPALATALGRADLLSDPRFSTPARIATNAAQLTAILDAMFAAQPIAHWRELFERTRVTFSVVREPQEVVEDLQLAANDVIVPVEGGADGLRRTISCPIQVHDVTKVPARRAPGIGEHSDEILGQLGFDAARIAQLHASGAVPAAAEHRG